MKGDCMNILYISYINPYPWSGPTYSVPCQIEAQSKIDNVLWYNTIDPNSEIAKKWMPGVDWKKRAYYVDLSDYPKRRIADLPDPFCKPDVIIVEQFYGFARSPLIKELEKCNTPYIIIPRGELAKDAQKRKWLKKFIANQLIFLRFARKAACIQYLTAQEMEDSGIGWNKNYVILSNGITVHKKKKVTFNQGCSLKCISIGRIEPYQKGFDLLIEACTIIQDELRKCNCVIQINGPDRVGRLEEMNALLMTNGIQDLIRFGDALYGSEKENELLNSDVFIMTSRFEGHPMSLIEAMDYGLPCIVTTGTNMRKEVVEADAGWGADNDAKSIARAILNMLKERERLCAKGKNAQKLASIYNWDTIALRSHDKYLEILEKKC